MGRPRFKISISHRGQHTFRLTAANGETILVGEPYGSRSGLERGITSVRENARLEQRYDRRTSHTAQHYFVLRAENGEVIGISEMYPSQTVMEKHIESVRANAATALIDA